MNRQKDLLPQIYGSDHLVRRRMNDLLAKATEKPLTIVCAGTGYGKTRAVYDFVQHNKMTTLWVRLSEHDNIPSRFWEDFTRSIASAIDRPDMDNLKSLGFPDAEDKMGLFVSIRDSYTASMPDKRYLTVIDDFHLINNPDVLRFTEWIINQSSDNRPIILISREYPQINLADLQNRGDVYAVQETDLDFTVNEVGLYLNLQGLSVEPHVLNEIWQDTNGWAFSVNFVVRSLKKAPGYKGFAREAMKTNVFSQMELQMWGLISDPLKHFLLRLSLIAYLPAVLVNILANGDALLLDELKRQNAYIRYDANINTYLIHRFFLDFLRSKQGLLTDGEKRKTYQKAAEWCEKNGSLIYAIRYYEQAGDYPSIVSILLDIPFFLPRDLALCLEEVFKRASKELFYRVDHLAPMFLRTLICLNREREFTVLADEYKRKFLAMPESSSLRNATLGAIYGCRGVMSVLLCTVNNNRDFKMCFSKMDEYVSAAPVAGKVWITPHLGPWVSFAGVAGQREWEEYSEAFTGMIGDFNHCLGIMFGLDDLLMGEMEFYQGDTETAERLIACALDKGREAGEPETVHRALFYLMRIAFIRGKLEMAERMFYDLESLREEKKYAQRFANCDIARGWYYYILRQPEQIPVWLKEKFSNYSHAYSPENFGNQIKARFHYATKNFMPLLVYIREMKNRESVLFGRIEMLAMEACVCYQMRDRAGAYAALLEAYDAAAPNKIAMPFIELGKDMRTLTSIALRDNAVSGADCGIPKQWLEEINNRSSHYARYQSRMISEYESAAGAGNWMALSPRETEILHDLYAGLSRAEIAGRQKLSVGTVNMNVNGIKTKLHAQNVTDIIRIAIERKLLMQKK